MKPVACDPWPLNTVWESVRAQILLWDKYKQTFPYAPLPLVRTVMVFFF